MQLSSGILAAFSYGCWQFRSGKMLCGWCMAFMWQSAMWAGNFNRAWCYVVVSGSCAAFSYACGLAT